MGNVPWTPMAFLFGGLWLGAVLAGIPPLQSALALVALVSFFGGLWFTVEGFLDD